MPSEPKDHHQTKQPIFAVLRLDFYDDENITIPRDVALWREGMGGEPCPTGIMGTKAYETPEEAWEEADRLNALNEDKGARYFVILVRFVRHGA